MSARTKRAVAIGLVAFLLVALFADGTAGGAGARGGLQTVVEVLVIGLAVGAIYSLIALGLALVYKAQRVFNFAQGEFGTVAIFAAWLLYTRPAAGGQPTAGTWLVDDLGLSPAAALVASSAVGFVVGVALAVVVYLLVVRKLAAASPVTTLVATAGVALLLVSLEIWVGEAQVRNFPRFVEGSFSVAGVSVEWQTVLLAAVLAAVAVLLAAFFRTRTGTALLATAQEPFAAQLYGVSTQRMALITWAAAGALGALGGLLAVGYFTTFTPGVISGTYLIPAFTAAILGGITSMPGAVAGGLLLGIVQASSNILLPSTWPGRPQIGVFAILLAVLLFFPRGLLGREA